MTSEIIKTQQKIKVTTESLSAREYKGMTEDAYQIKIKNFKNNVKTNQVSQLNFKNLQP